MGSYVIKDCGESIPISTTGSQMHVQYREAERRRKRITGAVWANIVPGTRSIRSNLLRM